MEASNSGMILKIGAVCGMKILLKKTSSDKLFQTLWNKEIPQGFTMVETNWNIKYTR